VTTHSTEGAGPAPERVAAIGMASRCGDAAVSGLGVSAAAEA
jgi:hypothetical protein